MIVKSASLNSPANKKRIQEAKKKAKSIFKKKDK